jgi:NADPH:quinone reductase-like Zn-dependent oxidoreductase
MKKVVYRYCGPPETLEVVEDFARPTAAPGHILVRIRAAGVNPIDWKVCTSHFMRLWFGLSFPIVPGFDIAGEVVEVGEGVTDFAVGDAVMAMLDLRQPAAYAEFVSVPAHIAVKKPASLDFVQAAALPLVGLTALTLLRKSGPVGEGSRVLVNGGSGGVGVSAIQLAKVRGAHVTAVTSARNVDLAYELGADEVIDYAKADPLSGGPYDVVLDTIGNLSFLRATRALTPRGAYASSDPPTGYTAVAFSMLSRRRGVGCVVRPSAADLSELCALVESGRFKPVIDRVFSLDETMDAHRYSVSGRVRGKVVLAVA